MIPFGRCVLLWRLKLGLSQGELAARAGIAQPNLSDIERGERDVSLRTLRALALALNIKPGLLADGTGPDSEKPLVLSREKLERISQAVVKGEPLSDPREKELASHARRLLLSRLQVHSGSRARGRKGLAAQRAWLTLSSRYSSSEIESLINRIAEKGVSYQARKAAV